MSANVPRIRAYSAPPCPHFEDTTGQRVGTILYEIVEARPGVQGPTIVDWEWQVNRDEAGNTSNGNLKNVFVPMAAKAGDLLLPSPIEVLEFLMRDHVDLGAPNEMQGNEKEKEPTPIPSQFETQTESHDAKKLNCSGDPSSCVMCGLLKEDPELVSYITCLQYVQSKKGCKHDPCGYCHPPPEEIGDDKDECKVFKLTGFCRFRQQQPGQKMCNKTHHEANEPHKYLPTITHKLSSKALYDEAMACIHKFVQHMNETPKNQ